MRFDIEIKGLDQVISRIDGIRIRANDLSAIARDTALVIQADVDERFDTAPSTTSGGAVYGGLTWEPLTEAYLKRNPRRQGGQLLRDTGELQQSFTIGNSGNVFQYDNHSVTFGSALPKARGLAKKRPMIVVHDELVDTIQALWREYVFGNPNTF